MELEAEADVAEEQEAMFRDWAGLPGDLLTTIGELLGLPGRLCFRCVCRSWSDAVPAMPSPWLVVPDGPEVYCRERFTVLSLPPRSPFRWWLPGQRCVGSSDGWLAFVDANLCITLLNPLSDTRPAVRLPPLPIRRNSPLRYVSWSWLLPRSTDGTLQLRTPGEKLRFNELQHEFVQRVAFAPNPTAQDYAVAVFCRYEQGLAFTRAGSQGWQWFDWPIAPGRAYPEHIPYDFGEGEIFYVNDELDLVYHGGRFYYMTLCGQIWSLDVAAPPPVAPVRVAKWRPPGPDYRHYVKHLVFTGDGAMHVVWSDMPGVTEALRHRPMRMSVKRYDPAARRWRKVKHLGGSAFLIGQRSQSVAVVPAASSRSTWLRPNCVYFTNITPGTEDNLKISELPEELDEILEFNVEDGSFRSCDRRGKEFSWVDWPRGIWFTPRVESNGQSSIYEIVPVSENDFELLDYYAHERAVGHQLMALDGP